MGIFISARVLTFPVLSQGARAVVWAVQAPPREAAEGLREVREALAALVAPQVPQAPAVRLTPEAPAAAVETAIPAVSVMWEALVRGVLPAAPDPWASNSLAQRPQVAEPALRRMAVGTRPCQAPEPAQEAAGVLAVHSQMVPREILATPVEAVPLATLVLRARGETPAETASFLKPRIHSNSMAVCRAAVEVAAAVAKARAVVVGAVAAKVEGEVVLVVRTAFQAGVVMAGLGDWEAGARRAALEGLVVMAARAVMGPMEGAPSSFPHKVFCISPMRLPWIFHPVHRKAARAETRGMRDSLPPHR